MCAPHPSALCRREEQVFEKEAVLGRDVDSVFPTEAKQADQDLAASAEALVK